MAFLGFCNVYTLRVNLSVGIVAMTENRTIHYENGTTGFVSQINSDFDLVFLSLTVEHTLLNHHTILGTTLPLEFQRARSHTEFILLRLHYDTVHWGLFWGEDRRQFGVWGRNICDVGAHIANSIGCTCRFRSADGSSNNRRNI